MRRPGAAAWRLKSAVLTQSGGEEWMKDAVILLTTSAHRRRDCEGEGEGEATGSSGASGAEGAGKRKKANSEENVVGEWLAWSLPITLSDGDINKILDVLPSHAALEDCGGVRPCIKWMD